jgi:hypothetical protein
MLNHEEKIRISKKKKKLFITGLCIIIAVFIIIALISLILQAVNHSVQERRWQQHEDAARVHYVYPPDTDWDRNIFEDSFYMSLDRMVRYSDGMAVTGMTEENKNTYPPEAQFMFDVIQLIINGDYDAYNDIFADEYWENVKIEDVRAEFTMQPLYNIEMEIVGGTETTTDVKLSYMISKNDGTFRNDLPFNEPTVRPVVYRLVTIPFIDENGERQSEIKVLSKSNYSFAVAGDFE